MLGTSRLQGPGNCARLLGVDLVRGTKADERRAGSRVGSGERGWIGKTFAVDRLDPAGLEKALCKCGACGEIGRCASIGEKHARAYAFLLQVLIRAPAKPL